MMCARELKKLSLTPSNCKMRADNFVRSTEIEVLEIQFRA